MQKGTKGVHYKPASELRTKTLNIRVTASQLALIKAKAMDDGLTTSAWVIKTLMDSTKTSQEETAPTATPAPEQAQSAPSQTDQATGDKPNRPATKAKTTTTRRRKTSTTADDETPAPKSSSTPRRKTTTRRASASRRKVVAEKDSAA